MINIYLEQSKKKYIEIIVDDFGCNLIMNNLKSLKITNAFLIDLSKQDKFECKKGYMRVEFIQFRYHNCIHFANTDYNIKCSLMEPNKIDINLSLEGITELLNILEFIRDHNDHFHLYGGFNLYTGEGEYESKNILNAITIYNEKNI